MKIKDKIYITLLCAIIIMLYFAFDSYNKINEGKQVYNIYLDGEVIGAISDKEALYNLIDERQQDIKAKYNVKNVYPPDSLKIVETYSYNTEVSDIDTIYKQIEGMQDFTIHGYEVSVSQTDDHDSFQFYVLDKNVLFEAIRDFILAFVDEDDYEAFLNGTQEDLDDIGIYYSDMKIIEDITIREKYISINEKIYDNSDELAQQLLFGFNYKEQSYTIKAGDSIESISEANTLNTQEFLIANPKYASKDSLLAIGDTVNITLIDPEISFAYAVKEMLEVEEDYDTKTERDNSKPSGYSEIKQPGIKGLSIQTKEYSVVNGEPNGEAKIINNIPIRTKIDQITVKGRQSVVWGTQTYVDTGSGWRWPTTSPYAITSEFAPRWGKVHGGIDISGTGWGSNIYAANDGVVIHVNTGCPDNGYYGNTCGSGFGNYVVIDHGNNYFTLYGHMINRIPVKVGQTVSRGTIVGYMGNSGSSTGMHLHFAVSTGDPRAGGKYFNPRDLYR